MPATARHLSVKLTEADAAALDTCRQYHGMDTDSQLVRWLLRREARAIGHATPEADPMPPPGRKKARRK